MKWQRKQSGLKPLWQYAHDLSCWTMLRRIYSNRTFFETMVDFWLVTSTSRPTTRLRGPGVTTTTS